MLPLDQITSSRLFWRSRGLQTGSLFVPTWTSILVKILINFSHVIHWPTPPDQQSVSPSLSFAYISIVLSGMASKWLSLVAVDFNRHSQPYGQGKILSDNPYVFHFKAYVSVPASPTHLPGSRSNLFLAGYVCERKLRFNLSYCSVQKMMRFSFDL